jgi:hypothetical protein
VTVEVVAMLDWGATDHRGLRVMTFDECLELLQTSSVGRLAFAHDGEPEVLPVTFGLDGMSPVFRTTWGSKLEAVGRGRVVALEVDRLDSADGVAWSVVVKGTGEIEYDDEAVARYERLGVPVWVADLDDPFWVRITPSSVTGRVLDLP